MNRNVFLPLLTALFLFCAASAQAEEKSKVIVLPFAINAGPSLAYLEDSLPKFLTERLTGMGFDIVPQEDTLACSKPSIFEYLDLNVKLEDMALLAGAGYAVYGSFSQVGENMSIDARLVDAMA